MFSKIFQFYLKTDQRKNKPKNFLFKPISFFFKKKRPQPYSQEHPFFKKYQITFN